MTDEPTACVSELNRLTQTLNHLLSDEKRTKRMMEALTDASDFALAVMGAVVLTTLKRLRVVSEWIEAQMIARMEARGLNPAGNVTQWNLPGQVVVTLEKKNRSKPAPNFNATARQLYELMTAPTESEETRTLAANSLKLEWTCPVRAAQQIQALGGLYGSLAERLYVKAPEKPILKITMPGCDQ